MAREIITPHDTLAPLRAMVDAADAAWFAALGGPDEKAAKAVHTEALKAFRDAEKPYLGREFRDVCFRCGGEGGYQGWPGFTCFRCGGTGDEFRTYAKHRFQATPPTRAKRAAEHAAEQAERDAQYVAAIKALGDTGVAIALADAKVSNWRAWDEHAETEPDRSMVPDRDEHFLASMASALHKYGSLTEKQAAAVERLMERRAEREAERAAADPVPVGATSYVEGTVVSIKWVDSQYGTQVKMLVHDRRGFKVFGTMPRVLYCDQDCRKGAVVAFTAETARSDDDPLFGFFKRPKDARLVEAAREEEQG